MILIEPASGEFDVDRVTAYLAAQPFALRDTIRAEMFMLGNDDDDVEEAREAREKDPVRFPTHMILVEVWPTRINISYRSQRLDPAKRFVEWLRERYDLRFMDEEFNDITERARKTNVLFGDSDG
jgi:uncharacterized protein YcbX